MAGTAVSNSLFVQHRAGAVQTLDDSMRAQSTTCYPTALAFQVVTAQERMKVSHALQQEAACMAVMLSNACMVHKLVSNLCVGWLASAVSSAVNTPAAVGP